MPSCPRELCTTSAAANVHTAEMHSPCTKPVPVFSSSSPRELPERLSIAGGSGSGGSGASCGSQPGADSLCTHARMRACMHLEDVGLLGVQNCYYIQQNMIWGARASTKRSLCADLLSYAANGEGALPAGGWEPRLGLFEYNTVRTLQPKSCLGNKMT